MSLLIVPLLYLDLAELLFSFNARADDAIVSFGRELRPGKRIEFDERLSGYEFDDQTLSLDDSIALTRVRPRNQPKMTEFWAPVGRQLWGDERL